MDVCRHLLSRPDESKGSGGFSVDVLLMFVAVDLLVHKKGSK